MVKGSRLRITVLKKLKPKDIFGDKLPARTVNTNECETFKIGQQFLIDELGNFPEGFCPWAWKDLFTVITHLRFGEDFPWMLEKGIAIACCSDGFRPVIFKIERFDRVDK